MCIRKSTGHLAFTLLLASTAAQVGSSSALADEGGVSFWLPGQYGSLAAVPHDPGWSLPLVYYHTSADLSASKEIELGGEIVANIEADGNLVTVIPTYTFRYPVLGGQFALSLAGIVGSLDVGGEAKLGPLSIKKDDSVFGIGDLYPTMSIRRNQGTNNFLTYLTGVIPVGAYQEGRIANLSIHHVAIDGGAGYTYLNPATGREFSMTESGNATSGSSRARSTFLTAAYCASSSG